MDLTSITKKASILIGKYKYVLLILVIGFVLMSIPGKNETNKIASAESVSQKNETIPINHQLAHILSKIDGVGEVQVLLTVAAGEKILYQTDDTTSYSDTSNTTRIDTVTVTDDTRNQTGLIQQVIPPIYQGAIVVCQGADSPAVRLAIVEAVSKVTGLGADRISVLKMK